jgi:hypothetical protein
MSSQNKPGVTKGAARAEPDAPDLAHIDERRADRRRPTFKAGEIRIGEAKSCPCIVRNVSESGCLIKLENAQALPDLVEIRIDLDKPARQAEIVWRSTTLAGAMFIRKPS